MIVALDVGRDFHLDFLLGKLLVPQHALVEKPGSCNLQPANFIPDIQGQIRLQIEFGDFGTELSTLVNLVATLLELLDGLSVEIVLILVGKARGIEFGAVVLKVGKFLHAPRHRFLDSLGG